MNQGTIEWRLDRLGCISGSQFHRVMGSVAARNTYYQELLAERKAIAAGVEAATEFVQANNIDSIAMAWGRKHEDRARAAYEIEYDIDIEEVPFLRLNGCKWIGCSLDGISDQATLEIKCPYKLANHIRTCRDGMPAFHIPQVQGGLWITGKPWVDFVSYHPEYEAQRLYCERIPRDERYIDALAQSVLQFERALELEEPLPETEVELDEVPALF